MPLPPNQQRKWRRKDVDASIDELCDQGRRAAITRTHALATLHSGVWSDPIRLPHPLDRELGPLTRPVASDPVIEGLEDDDPTAQNLQGAQSQSRDTHATQASYHKNDTRKNMKNAIRIRGAWSSTMRPLGRRNASLLMGAASVRAGSRKW